MGVKMKLPNEYKGNTITKSDYTRSTPRKWTKEEIEWMLELKNKGYSITEIANSLDRTEVSIRIKFKRLGKSNNTYNKQHVDEKYSINDAFLSKISPSTILDAYCGEKKFYSENYDCITNDINKDIDCTYNKDAHHLLCELYSQNYSFDLIDLDPFGSAYDCFDLAIKMAKKGLIITLGELGHKRFKRLDYVSRYYDIDKLEDFNIENLIRHIQKIGLRNKKNLIIFDYKEWKNIGRVWFEIEPIKIIESQIRE